MELSRVSLGFVCKYGAVLQGKKEGGWDSPQAQEGQTDSDADHVVNECVSSRGSLREWR